MKKRELNTFSQKIKVKSTTENLSIIRDFIQDTASASGFGRDAVDKIILAVDEASTNIIKHAYKYNPEKEIEIKVTLSSGKFTIEIIDSGNSFDPDSVHDPDIRKYFKERKVGGLGIFLMKKLMDDVKYDTLKNHRNKVTLIKNVS